MSEEQPMCVLCWSREAGFGGEPVPTQVGTGEVLSSRVLGTLDSCLLSAILQRGLIKVPFINGIFLYKILR